MLTVVKKLPNGTYAVIVGITHEEAAVGAGPTVVKLGGAGLWAVALPKEELRYAELQRLELKEITLIVDYAESLDELRLRYAVDDPAVAS